jgi:hypothetical protein
MEARVAVAKVGKYATSESGDSFEMVEPRPAACRSCWLTGRHREDRKGCLIAVAQAISLLARGARSGRPRRRLPCYRLAKSRRPNILAVDLQSQTRDPRTIVPVVLIHAGSLRSWPMLPSR